MRALSKHTSTLLFMLLTGVLVLVAFISYNKIRQFNKSVDRVMHSNVVKDHIIELRSIIKDAESGQRGYLITNDSVFLQPFIGAEQRGNLAFATLDSLISDNTGQQENLKKLKTLFDERYLILNKNLKFFKNNASPNLPADSLMLESKNKMDEVRKQIAFMLKTEDTVLAQRIQVKNRSATITPIFLLLLSLCSIVALTLFFLRLQRETSARVSKEKLVEVEAAARKQIEENLREISDYKYALDESSIVAITDQKGIIKYVNDNFCTISKYTRHELIGHDHRIISSGYHPKAFIRNIWTTIANGKLWKGELKNKAKDGTIYWVDTTIVPFLDELGKPYQYVAIRSDITAQKKSAEAIETMAAHLTLATDSANVGTWSLNIQTQKLEWSVLHKKMWGYDGYRSDLTYEDWYKLILPGDKEKAFERIEDARVNHTDYDVEYRIGRADDKVVRYIRSFGKYYYNDKGEAETLTGISIDITEQKESELKLRASEEKYRGIFETMDQGFSIIEMIFDGDKKPVDCVYIETNPVFEKLTGLKNVIGKTAKELIPNIEEHWFQIYGKVALTGEPNRFIEGSEALGRWFETYTFRLGDQGSNKVAVLFTDITERKQVEEKIKEARELLEITLMNVPSAIYHFDKTGKILYLNEIGANQIGYATIEDVLAEKDVSQLRKRAYETFTVLNEQGKPMPADQNSTALTFQTGKSSEVVSQLIHKKTGASLWLLSKTSPFYDNQGGLVKVLTTSTDITMQKASEQNIRQSEEHFRTFANSIQNLAWIANADGWRYWYNQQWYDYTGTTLEEVEGWGWEKVHHPDHIAKVIEFAKEAWKKDEAFENIFLLRRHDGEYRWFLTRAYPVKDANGNIERWIGTNTDITEQKSLTEELEEKVKSRTEELHAKNIQLELANAELASFSYVASHDLKEPLRKIQAFSSRIIETEKFSDKTQEYFNRIISSGERMQNLIDALLNFSRVNSTELIFEPCDLNTLIEEAKNDLHISIIEKQAIIEHENLPVIMGVCIQISQLIINLLGNAIKYSRAGIKPLIKITSSVVEGESIEHTSANKQTKYHAIKIADNGIGFEQEYANKIFEPFQRLHGKHEYSGTGIGLGIVKKTVTNHNGFIIAEGKPNIGSTFTIYIPTA